MLKYDKLSLFADLCVLRVDPVTASDLVSTHRLITRLEVISTHDPMDTIAIWGRHEVPDNAIPPPSIIYLPVPAPIELH